MQDEQEQKMNGEQTQEQGMEKVPEETEKPAEEEPEKKPEHDAVGPGGVCRLCGWTFGDPVKGITPHIVYFGAARNEPEPPAAPEPAKVQPKPSGEGACEAIPVSATCPKCGWNYAEEMKTATPKAHPVII